MGCGTTPPHQHFSRRGTPILFLRDKSHSAFPVQEKIWDGYSREISGEDFVPFLIVAGADLRVKGRRPNEHNPQSPQQ